MLDGQSRAATASVTIDFPRGVDCPSNIPLKLEPASANARVTEILTFQITGSTPPYTVETSNPNIATAVVNGASVSVTAKSTGSDPSKLTATALITVTGSDQQKASIVFTVLPQ